MPAADPLAAEQAHLSHARRQLARMRERTLSLEAHGGDAVSSEYLAATLYRRAAALTDDPTSTLFFGRIDTDGTNPTDANGQPERWYVGRRHVADEAGDPVVVDWRADVSRAFYRASRAEPLGVRLRRRFGVDRGQITAYEDEHLTDTSEADRTSQILAGEIERPRVGPMRDIVATIQPEQDEIVRADVTTTVCVQGAPGTGKTAVGLHRAAWLLYAYRERLARSGVLVVGPNRAFLEHVGAVLPALGEVEVSHTTVEQLTATIRLRANDSADVAALKGDARLAEVLHRAVWASVREPDDALVVPRGSRRWRVPTHEVREIVAELRARGVRYSAARAMLPHRLAHAVLVQMESAGDSPDDRVQGAVARSRPVKAYADAVWPAVDGPRLLLRLWSDATFLAACADGVLTPEEQALLLWDRPAKGTRSAPWTAADAVLLDEVADVLERTPSLGHVVLDEAQDLSPMQLRAVGRRCSTGSMTVLGDIAQGTTPWATRSWAESLQHLGQDGAHVEELVRGFRVPTAVIDFAARLLPHMAPGLAAPVSVRDDPGQLSVVRVSDGALAAATTAAVRDALAHEGSVGLIVADAQVADTSHALADAGLEHLRLGRDDELDAGAADHEDGTHRLHLVPATVAKGLEFDRVVVVEPRAIAAAEPDERTGLRRLYVVLTRAVTGLTVVHARDLPAPLSGA
ncbi:AAA family ATPase [Angustibacter sp. Root456]|uniref:HelD family protein n=1 Tax=Angustibacter sp. Root456 TaxID=1736539 RepID=UPI0006FB8C60|nr:AAA family ATPase [Angustibacter sp. Root456]KQX67040.1 AAA family ATPase [Angustibacter sp. Root456]